MTERSLRALPKAHLHLRLDGAMRRSTFEELAHRAGVNAPLPTGYGSFADFTATITAAASLLTTEADAERLVEELVADAGAAGAVWVEPSMWPGMFGGGLGPDEAVIETGLAAGREAAYRHGVGFGLIVAANRDRGPDEALDVARTAVKYVDQGVGFGLDGDELAAPPELFADAFAVTRESGLLSVPHAGEHGPAANVRTAVEVLGANRVMHGVSAASDPVLLEDLAQRGTVLDVCPTSNLMLSAADSYQAHPLPVLLRYGVACSLGADDPLLFDTDLLSEYAAARDRMRLTDRDLAEVAAASLRASGAPPVLVDEQIARVSNWLAAS